MLHQMITEQDTIDKKQISLFGQKTNAQILGNNQNGMTNNIAKQGGEGKTSTDFWSLRNKDKAYVEVVSGSKKPMQDLSRAQSPDSVSQHVQSIQNKMSEEKGTSFLDRFNSNSNPQTMFIDKNCATCMQGTAPQIMSHIKLACLSFINQPISYMNVKLQFSDILQIKELLLV